MKVRLLVLGLTGIALASFAFMDALARVNERRLPQLSIVVPVPNGFADAAMGADLLVARARGGGLQPGSLTVRPSAKQASAVQRLSRLGYRREPMNAMAVRNLGLLAEARGDLHAARKLMDVAHGLTRRDLWADAWIANDRAMANQISAALRSYDEALRSSTEAQTVLLPTLLKNLKNVALVQPIIDLLRKRPPWQTEFWGEAPHYADSLVNLARIRNAVAQSRIAVSPTADLTLVSELANHGHFAEAESLNHQLGGGKKSPGGEALYNAGFDQPSGFAPFDWQLYFDSNLTADIHRQAGLLQISTFSDGSGPLVRQLVSLPADTYTLRTKAQDWDALDQKSLYFRLDCAEKTGPSPSSPIWLDRADFAVSFHKAQSGCRYYWLTLFALPQHGRADNQLTLDYISLRPVKSAAAP